MDTKHKTIEGATDIKAWLLTTGAARWLGMLSLGSSRVVLSWSKSDKRLALNEVDEHENVTRNIFDRPLSSVSRVFFYHSHITLVVDSKKYSVDVRDTLSKHRTVMDALVVASPGAESLASAYVDEHSNVAALQSYLTGNNVNVGKTMIPSKSYVKVFVPAIIIVTTLVIIGLVLITVLSATRG